jgi:hypothetical protein
MSTETTWADRELVRIKALPNADLIIEVHNAMNGHTYSWRVIQRRLQRLDTDNNIYLDWIDLCKLKQTWDRIPSLTRERQHKDIVERLSRDLSRRAWNLKHLRTLLINLKLILIRAGLEEEEGIFLNSFTSTYTKDRIAIQLVSQNLDESSKGGVEDLWMPYEKCERYFVNGKWDNEDAMDEETPLLAHKAGSQNLRRFWGKLLSWM